MSGSECAPYGCGDVGFAPLPGLLETPFRLVYSEPVQNPNRFHPIVGRSLLAAVPNDINERAILAASFHDEVDDRVTQEGLLPGTYPVAAL
jgi:hypothetical protein